jgi:hypothetical protein
MRAACDVVKTGPYKTGVGVGGVGGRHKLRAAQHTQGRVCVCVCVLKHM